MFQTKKKTALNNTANAKMENFPNQQLFKDYFHKACKTYMLVTKL